MSRRLFTIAPHARFLDVLADRIIDGTLVGDWDRTGPFWLADVTIILPTQRARLALADAFTRRGHALLPDIRTFGGEVPDEEPFLPPVDASALPPAVSALERRLVLSRLVAAWADTPDGRHAFATPPNAAEILALAESLGTFLDDMIAEKRSPADLDGIVPDELSANWQQTLTFLKIVLEYWPVELAQRGKADAFALRNVRLERQAETAPLVYGERPVIAAGSTGSIPATARLLSAIANLPRGALVLPGLDTSLTPQDHEHLIDPRHNPHGHPQYGLAKLLRGLGAGIGEVVELAPEENLRTTLVRRALAPTEVTAHWADMRLIDLELGMATESLAVLAARSEDEEARAIALAARAALVDKRTVGIVTPDQNLARRIAAELARFGIEVDDAAGQPLFQSPAGRLVRQILALAVNRFAPVDLMALLNNRAATFGMARADVTPIAHRIEMGLLRGQRPNPGIAGLHTLLDANISKATTHPALRLNDSDRAEIESLLTRIEDALADLSAMCDRREVNAGTFISALMRAYDLVTAKTSPKGSPNATNTQPKPSPNAPKALSGGDELRLLASEIARHSDEGVSFAPHNLDNVLYALMAGIEVRNVTPRRGDIAIWGQLEARLQGPDLMIVAALNEDKWPEPADPGPWLSRGMRLAAGLEPPERKQGLAAHDFEMAAGNSDVILAFSQRVGGSPALPSRLLQRLEAFIGEDCARRLRARGDKWLDDARRLDASPTLKRAPIPAPNPPISTRPRKLSITEIETLFRSPYDIYAKHILGLRPLDRLGEDPDARERGNLIHLVFGDFIEHHDPMAPDALLTLNTLATQAFSGLEAIADRRDIWLRRFARAAELFLAYERTRNARVSHRFAEIRGEWIFAKPDGPFTLTGRADRIDLMTDGTVEIIDFKTGSVPAPKDMTAFDAPQLLLEAAMTAAGKMEGVAAAEASALTYIKVSFGPNAFNPKDFSLEKNVTLMEAANEAVRRTSRHVDAFLYHEMAMTAQVRPVEKNNTRFRRFSGPYEHLARVAEWALAEGEDEP
jgi:ATP-dependent helicase/nuclease subunit B